MTRPILVTVLALACSACGDGRLKLCPVRGQLFVAGQPATDAMVYLHLEDGDGAGVHPFAQVGPDGSFAVSTYENGDGAPPGRYALTFTWKEASGLARQHFEGPDRLKGKYAQAGNSPHRVTVGPGPTDLGRIDLAK